MRSVSASSDTRIANRLRKNIASRYAPPPKAFLRYCSNMFRALRALRSNFSSIVGFTAQSPFPVCWSQSSMVAAGKTRLRGTCDTSGLNVESLMRASSSA